MSEVRDTSFGWQVIVGSLDMDVDDYMADTMFGLPMSQTFLYGTTRDADGHLWTPMRRLTATGGEERLLLQSDVESSDLKPNRAGRFTSTGAGARRSRDGTTLKLESAPDQPGNRFLIEANPSTLHWVEDGTLELHGRAVPPSLHWHLPDRKLGMYYLSQIYEVEGQVLGRDVRGFIPVDQIFMHGMIYKDDLFVGEKAEVAWYTWATRYTDGTFQGGHFMIGHRKLGFAIVYSDTGMELCTTDVDGEVTLDASGIWPERVEITTAGQHWEFLPAPTGHMVSLMPMPNPQNEGRWQRVGETRTPAHWFAWGEVAPAHGTKPRR
ncbi:MAG: hypothetical protein AB7L13_08395 [Acidimicrobiia bacterium]